MEGVLAAVADESRWKILRKLSMGRMCACELPGYVGITQPAVSQHLKVLLESSLVEVKSEGAKRIYSISQKGRKVLSDVSSWQDTKVRQ